LKTPKRIGKPKKVSNSKSTLLFDFLNDITYEKENILTTDNEYAYSKYMITRFLSMYEPYIQLVDVYLNKYQACLDNFEFHKLCLSLIPKKKLYLKYIKGTPLKQECASRLKYICDYFQVSENEAYDYYLIAREPLVDNIKKMYGII